MRLFGVEEELLLVDPRSGYALPVARQLLSVLDSDRAVTGGTALTVEMQQEMIEVVSPPCATLPELRKAISHGRIFADAAAQAVGARVAALATAPLEVIPHATGKPRYQEMMLRYGVIARESLTCGFHVHVSIESPSEGVAVMDRIRVWLPIIRALSANSPYCRGIDTGHASYRAVAWSQWPSAGPVDVFGSPESYARFEQQMLDAGVLMDEGMLYFDARLSRTHPTVEIRVADVCLRQDDAAVIAALIRALVETAAQQWRERIAPSPTPSAVIRLASWKAALNGVRDELVHPGLTTPAPAREVVAALLEHVGAALDEVGDRHAVEAGVETIFALGCGADVQRSEVVRLGSIAEMVCGAVDLTLAP